MKKHLDDRCSCGIEVQDCGFWKPIAQKIKKGKANALRVGAPIQALNLWRKLLLYLPIFPPKRIWPSDFKTKFRKQNDEAIDYIGDQSGKKTIIDASKSIYRAFLLRTTSRHEVKILYSHRNGKNRMDSAFGRVGQRSHGYFLRYIFRLNYRFKIAQVRFLIWMSPKSVFHVNYRDLSTAPVKTTHAVLDYLNLPREELIKTIDGENVLIRDQGHTIGGNRLIREKVIPIKSTYRTKWRHVRTAQQFLFYLTAGPLYDLYFDLKIYFQKSKN